MGWILSSNLEDGLNFHLRIAVQMMAIPTTQEARTAMMVMVVCLFVAAPPTCGGGLLSEEELAGLVDVWYTVDGSAEEEGELAGELEGAGGAGVDADEELDKEEEELELELELEELEELEELDLDELEPEDDRLRLCEGSGRPTEDELLSRLFEEAGGEEAEGDELDEKGSPPAPPAPPSPPPSNPPTVSTGIRFRIIRFTSA